MSEEKGITVTNETTDLAIPFAGDPSDNGFGAVDESCVRRPFLKIAQSSTNTKELNRMETASYMSELREGDFFCGASRKIYSTVGANGAASARFIIIKFDHNYAIYKRENPDDKKSKRKFQSIITVSKFNSDVKPRAFKDGAIYKLDGLEYSEQLVMVLLNADHPEDGPMMFNPSVTSFSAMRQWLTLAMAVTGMKDGKRIQAPIYTSVWAISTVYTNGDLGNYYKLSSVSRVGWVPAEFGETVLGLYNQFKSVEGAELVGGDDEESQPSSQTAPQSKGAANVAQVFGRKPEAAPAKEVDGVPVDADGNPIF